VKPSFNHRLVQFAQVTIFPVQLWAISWIATEVPDISPVMMLGDAKVNKGFSIPPKGKEGGRITIL